MTTIAVVGMSLAGLRAAQALRTDGFAGELLLIGDEAVAPYDRPPLTKGFLCGDGEVSDLALAAQTDLESLDATWLLGSRATGLGGALLNVDGADMAVDGVVVTTGCRARVLPDVPANGVHTLRTINDALALRSALVDAEQVVVVGAGFVGTEVASSIAGRLGKRVTIVEPDPLPLLRHLGPEVGRLLADVYLTSGVELRLGVGLVEIAGRENVTHVNLTDGSRIAADLVVLGIGAVPNTEWLAGSGVRCADGISTDEWGQTSLRRVVAAGDVARYRHRGAPTRVEHWTNARDMPQVAARALLADLNGTELGAPHEPVPYFWSDQFGIKLQLCGYFDPAQPIELVDGAIEDSRFVAVQRRDGGIRSVLGWSSPREFTRWRRQHDAAIRCSPRADERGRTTLVTHT